MACWTVVDPHTVTASETPGSHIFVMKVAGVVVEVRERNEGVVIYDI